MATLVEFSVEGNAFPLGELFATLPGVSVELERIVPTSDSLFPYVWIQGASRAAVTNALETACERSEFTLVDELESRGLLYRVNWDPNIDGIVSAIVDSDVTLLSATGKRNEWTFRLRVADHDELGAFQDRCRNVGVRIDLSRLLPLEYDDGNGDERITPPQLEALELAFQRGYFDDPRRATLDDLATELEITRQSLAGRLRRGHRNLLAGLFGSSGGQIERERATSLSDR
ncbi:helix-turn-helix domain-containing protein [Natronobacterium texcoconense]|uniref:GAF and HTH_10 associated domain-containing protein n=1 Tax=Natronobacterium texcoconense TaxID=1095778 RepID=A0A1H1HR23_NATTX|nr:helix-turn-helix domain-containing protein [Natronobacterium texcoconense]SDR27506.1 GAF and HTH_10 associated domain-containing protein [Natronobacterium texcoconense]